MSLSRRLSQALGIAVGVCAAASQVQAQPQAALDVARSEHITGETPRIPFLHYWGKGNAIDLAKGGGTRVVGGAS